MAVEQKRLFIGGLHQSVTEQEVRDRFSRHGTISSVEIKTKKDLRGNPVKTFAYLDICLPESELKKCMSTYNNAKWKGNVMQIQLAKESFLTKLNQERAEMVSPSKSEVPEKLSSPSFQAVAEKRLSENFQKFGASDFNVKGKVPGTLVEGEKNWVVGKYGRVLPIVYIRRKDKQKVVCYDPSKYSHHVKRLKDEGRTEEAGDLPPLSKLTWQLPEGDSENMLKRKGVFPQGRPLMIHRKRIKDMIAVRREQLLAGSLPVSRTAARARRQYNSDSSEDFFNDDDESSDDSIATPYHYLQGNDHLLQDADDHDEESKPSDFEIVTESHTPRENVNAPPTNSFSLHSSHAHGIFPRSDQSAEIPDDSDRDSVDTDEICSSFKTLSARARNAAETHNRKEDARPLVTEFRDESPGGSKRMKVSLERDGGGDESDDIQRMQSKGDVTLESDCQIKKRSLAPEEIKRVKKVRKSSQAQDGPSVISCHSSSSNEDADKNDSDIDVEHAKHQGTMFVTKQDEFGEETADSNLDFQGLTSEGSILQRDRVEDGETQSCDPDDDLEGKDVGMNPVAIFDFEPLILDRAVLNGWNRASGCGQDTSMDTQQTCSFTGGGEVDDSPGIDDERTSSHLMEEEEEEEEEHGATGGFTSDNDIDNETSKVPYEKDANKSNDQTEYVSRPDRFDIGSKSSSEPLGSSASPEEGAKTATPKKLSKAAKKKLAREFAEKQRLANERRLESAKLQQRALLDRQAAIRGALAAVDSKDKKQGKHITFDSDGDDDDDEDNSGAVLPVAVPLPESKPVEAASRQKKHGQLSLFGSDGESSSSQDEDDRDSRDDDDDDQRFRIKPQYEGMAGQKLREMEERYGGDDRFKLSQHFLDDEEEEEGDVVKDDTMIVAQDEVSSDLQEEKQRSLAILQAMMGTEAVKAVKSKEPNFKDPGLLHYDPNREEHSKYEIKRGEDNDSDAKKLEQELQREKRKLEEERAKMPEVSKEKFFEVSGNLKDAFSSGGHKETEGGEGEGGMFTFFGPDDTHSGEEEDAQKDPERLDLASSLFPSKRFKYDSSSDTEDEEAEEEGEEKMEAHDSNEKTQNTTNEPGLDVSTTCTFFFQPKDQRLNDGAQIFCRPKDQAAMANSWEEVKAQLQNDFRKRHRRAVRDQKTSKKWTKKPTKAKK